MTSEVWNDHILVDHAEMNDHVRLIIECLESPDQVNYDSDYKHRESFYLLEVAGTNGNRHIKVCVEYKRRGLLRQIRGEIRTAFVARKVKESEETKWRRSS